MSIEDRLAHLECENRRLKVAGLLVLVAAASVFLMGLARAPQRVEADTFVVRNRQGVITATLGAAYEANGEPAGAWLAFYDYKPDGGPAVGTFFQGGGGQEGFLQLNGDSGKRIVLLRTGYDDIDPTVSVTTPSGVRWSAP
jgi:hypothetical protein